MVFQQKLLEKTFVIVEITGPAMVLPVSSDFWKAPYVCLLYERSRVNIKFEGGSTCTVYLLFATFDTSPLFFTLVST